MGALADYLKNEADSLRTERSTRASSITDWQQSLEKLYELLCSWIEVADGGLGFVKAIVSDHSMQEPRLGTYTTKKLTIKFGDDSTGNADIVSEVVPKARFVLATISPPGRETRPADGHVEIREGKIASYYLFRWKNPDGDEWFICSDARWNSWSYGKVEPLNSESFEAAVLSTVR
jgi:hypothetical protein